MRVLHYKPTMMAEEGGVVKAVFDLCMQTESDRLGVGLATYHVDLVRDSLPPDAGSRMRLHKVDLPHPATRLLSKRNFSPLREVIAGYDLVHLHTIWTPSNMQVIRICRELGIPYVLTVHGMLDDWCLRQSRLRKWVYLRTWARDLLSGAEQIHATSSAEREQIDRFIGTPRAVTIPLPVQLDDAPGPSGPPVPPASDPAGPPVLLFLSRIHPKKGLDRLVRASALLHQRGVDHRLVVAGTGKPAYTASVRRLVDQLGIGKCTDFLGFVDGAPKARLYRDATVFALPTSQENFGFVYFEALAAGTPVVTTRGADTWQEIVESGGGLVADNTPEAFADAIGPLLLDPARAKEMGARGRAWARPHFDRARIVAAYEDFYARSLGADA